MIRFEITGETPSKKNVNKFNTRTKAVYKDKRYQAWHTGAMLQMNAQKACNGQVDPINSPVAIALTFYHGDQVRRDSDNQTSSIMDLLQDAKVLADDRWQIVRRLEINNEYDKGNARCLIEIKGL